MTVENYHEKIENEQIWLMTANILDLPSMLQQPNLLASVHLLDLVSSS